MKASVRAGRHRPARASQGDCAVKRVVDRAGWESAALGLEAHDASRGSFPVRPALPPVLGCALGLWAACAAVLEAARLWEVAWCVLAACAGALVAAAAAVLLWRARAVFAWAVLLGLALGIACGAAFAVQLHGEQARLEGLSGTWRFEVAADGSQGAYGSTCYARVLLPDGTRPLVRVLLPKDEAPLRYGQAFSACAQLSAPSQVSAAYGWRQGSAGDARVSGGMELCEAQGVMGGLVQLRGRAVDLLSQQKRTGAGVLAALVCGWRADLDEDVYADFKVAGLAHLVAVSGAHLAIVSAFSAGVMRALRVPRGIAAVLQMAMLLCYLVLTAAPPSAVRAAAMAGASLFSFTAKRRPAALSALSLCIAAFVALQPQAALSASFALSALATLGIVLFSNLLGSWVERVWPAVPAAVRDALALTFASGVLATPLSAALFSQLPLAAPLANVAAAPLFAPLCAGGLAAVFASLVVPGAAGALVPAACAGADLLIGVVGTVSQLPYASVPVSGSVACSLVASGVLAAGLWVFWRPLSRRALLAFAGAAGVVAVCAALAVPRLAGDEIIMLDVGQGDAFVLRSRGAAVLVDTGNQDGLLRAALARHGVYRLDAVVVTHGDDDHMGSLASLAGVVEVDRVLVARDALTCGCDACLNLCERARHLVGEDGVQGVSVGDRLQVGAFDVRVVWPRAFADEGGNADSVCLVSDVDVNGDGACDWRALFTGDAECDQLRELVDSGAVGKVDVYKVGHHGSANALDDEEAAVLSPSLALVSAGANNRYGHPKQETLDRLEAVGARIVRTDEAGDVSCELKADRIEVETLR